MTRKQMYRQSVLKRLPQLRILDEQEVQLVERRKPDIITFTEVSGPPLVHLSQPHISAKMPVRLTAMKLDNLIGPTDGHSMGYQKRRPQTQASTKGARLPAKTTKYNSK